MTNSNNLPKFKIGQSVSYNGQHAKITKQRCYPEEIKKGKSPFFYDIIYISKYTNEVRENFGIRETTFKTYSQ